MSAPIFIKLDARGTIAGLNQCVNVFHIRTLALPTTTAEVQAVVDVFKTFYDNLASVRQGNATMTIGTRVVADDASNTTPPQIWGTVPRTSVIGTSSGAVPAQLAAVISWRTPLAGRSYRGRTFLGLLGGAAQNGAVLQGSAVTTINSSAATLISGLAALSVAGGGCSLAVYSKKANVCTDIISGTTDATYDTMRSRVK